MTNEQKEKALAFLKDMQECTYDGVEEIRTAIESLEQQPSDDEITITMKKGTLKYSGHGYVVYNKDWFRKHFATEVKIMTGYDGYIEQQPSDETIKYLECNDIDVQEFIKAIKRQSLQAVNPNSMQLIFEQMNRPTSDDCMSRAEVRKLICKNNDKYGYSDRFHEFTEECLALPTVTPTRKSGLRWIERFDNEDKWLECPHCHKDSDNAYAYCPNCGASFKEEKRGSKNGSN